MNMEGTAVLLSIRPEWCQKIFRGEKTMEIRKSFPKDFQGQPFKCFIYCTKGQNAGFRLEPDGGLMRLDGTVIGEFTCDRVYEIAPLNHAPDDLEAQACMDRDQIQEAYGYGEITSDRRDKLTDLWEAREAAQRKGKKDGKYHDLVTDMLARAIHSVGIEYADEIAAYEEERRMRRSYYEKVENRANGLQEEEPEEPDPLSPARAAIATAMQAAKVSEVTGAPLPKPLTWKRGFYDTTRTFPSGWYECPVCGCRVDWEPEQCPKCYTRLELEETEG